MTQIAKMTCPAPLTTYWDPRQCPRHWRVGTAEAPCECRHVAGKIHHDVVAVMGLADETPHHFANPHAVGDVVRMWKVELTPGYYGGSAWVSGCRFPEGSAEDALVEWRRHSDFGGRPWAPGLPRLVSALGTRKEGGYEALEGFLPVE